MRTQACTSRLPSHESASWLKGCLLCLLLVIASGAGQLAVAQYHSQATVNLTAPSNHQTISGQILISAPFTIARPAFAWPINGQPASPNNISTPFGYRIHPITEKPGFHRAIDIPHPEGTEVEAADAGTVRSVVSEEDDKTYGNNVWIAHTNGLRTHYSHLSVMSVGVNDAVNAGQKVGEVGSTGLSTGNHLDFEVRDSLYVNPGDVLHATRADDYVSIMRIKELPHPAGQIRTLVRAFLDGEAIKNSEKPKEQGQITNQLYERHWTPSSSQNGKHVFTVNVYDVGQPIGGRSINVTINCPATP